MYIWDAIDLVSAHAWGRTACYNGPDAEGEPLLVAELSSTGKGQSEKKVGAGTSRSGGG